MADEKKIDRLKLMLEHVDRVLGHAAPDRDMRIVERLLSDALALVIEINEPPSPYADRALRPGLTRSEENPDV